MQLVRSGSALIALLLVVSTEAGDSPRDYDPSDFDGPVFLETSGFVVVEAESVPLSARWSRHTDAPGDNSGGCGDASSIGYTGTGYMRWDGPNLMCAVLGEPEGSNHSDINQACQGSKDDWMVIKVYTENPGGYTMKARVFHHKRDGDNDWWGGYIGMTGTITRNANCHVETYSWPDWNNFHGVQLAKGLNAVYIAGRSKGIGIDRVVLYKGNIGETAAYNLKVPESPRQGETLTRQGVAGVREPGRMSMYKVSQGMMVLIDGSPLPSGYVHSLQGRRLAPIRNGLVSGSLAAGFNQTAGVSFATDAGTVHRLVSLPR